jgi:hypothetical protein
MGPLSSAVGSLGRWGAEMLAWAAHDLGLLVLTVLVLGLTAFLVHVMIHPERI